jgi:acyl carrier protein
MNRNVREPRRIQHVTDMSASQVSATGDSTLLIDVARATVAELRGHDATAVPISLGSSIQSDLGLDSLARVELLHRVEQAFGVRLPDATFESVTTLGDLLQTIDRAGPRHVVASRSAGLPQVAEGVEPAPETAATLIDVLRWHADRHPHAVGQIVVHEHGEQHLTYDQLWQGAHAVAGGLEFRGVAPGDTVALMLPTGADYFIAFMGVLLGGCVPVPIYPAASASQLEEHVRRQARILGNAGVVAMLTDRSIHRVGRLLQAHVPRLRRIESVAELAAGGRSPSPATVVADSIAMLQYTSGSTGDPKGVTLTHANLLANIRAMGRTIQVTGSDLFVSWLPLYHDMGLIGAWLGTLYFGLPLVVMSPLTFLARPERWLWAIHRHHATLSAAPNFAYELCVKRIAEADLAGLDLSSWRVAFNGAEAVIPETLDRFCERFARYGFRREALTAVYGLAECAVGLTFPPLGRGPVVDCIEREAFMRTGEARVTAPDAPNPLRVVGCGLPLPGYEVRVVDASGRESGERQEGRLEFKGPSATKGYFNNQGATERLFRDGWLDSGDRAYLARGEVFLTGRIKDIVIRAGRHIHPDELEAAVGTVSGVRKGCVAIFGSHGAEGATERLVVLAESYAVDPQERAALSARITTRIVEVLGEPPDDVVLVPPHTVLKTSSGKIRRSASRDIYEGRTRLAGPRAVWWQMLRLAAGAVRPELQRVVQSAGRVIYAGYFWVILYLLGAGGWLAVAALPRRGWAWRAGHAAARAIVRAARLPLTVRGAEHLPRSGPCVVVANHSSYLDGLIALAILALPCCFIAKRELRDQRIPRVFLERLGALFVAREQTLESVASAEAMTTAVRHGEVLIVFAEGTFTRAPGLLPFHLGGFLAAAAAGAPTVPVAIRGTRSVLRDGQWFPRLGPIAVEIGPTIPAPSGLQPLAAALRIRDVARAHIAAHCGEPELRIIGSMT